MPRTPRRRGARRNGERIPAWLGPWLMLITGLILGWSAYYVYLHEPKPKPVKPAPPAPPRAALPHRSRFKFYSMLPEVETILPRYIKPSTVGQTERRAPGPPAGDHYELQTASFPDFADADHMKARLALRGLDAHIQKVTIQGRGVYYRVRLGPYFNLAALDRVDRRLAVLGVHALRLDVHPLPGTR